MSSDGSFKKIVVNIHGERIVETYVPQEQFIRLKDELSQLRCDIENYADDTVWVGPCETACDRITYILDDEWEPGNPKDHHPSCQIHKVARETKTP